MSELPQASIDLLRRLNKDGYLTRYFDRAEEDGPHAVLIENGYARAVGGYLVASGEGFKALEEIDRDKEERARELPDIESCLRMNVKLHQRMRELGWQDAIYCPKDGTRFDAVEFGMGAIGPCHYDGEWPDGHWWMYESGDLWLSHPVMFKPNDNAINIKTFDIELYDVVTRDIRHVHADVESEEEARAECAREFPQYRINSIVERPKPALSDGEAKQDDDAQDQK